MNYEKWFQDMVNYRYLLGDLEELEEWLPVAA